MDHMNLASVLWENNQMNHLFISNNDHVPCVNHRASHPSYAHPNRALLCGIDN